MLGTAEQSVLPSAEPSKPFPPRVSAAQNFCASSPLRRQFKSREQAEGEKNRLEIEGANGEGLIRAVNTRLTDAQLAEAEAAFVRLAGKPLAQAVEWYLSTYRPPTVEKPLSDIPSKVPGEPPSPGAVSLFLAAKAAEVRPPMLADYRKTLRALERHFPGRHVHTLNADELEAFLRTLGPSAKSWNNQRGNLHALFEYAVSPRRRWANENPVKQIEKRTVSRGIPQIETAARVAEIFAFLEGYTGECGTKPAGWLCPYFATIFFAGVRPSIRDGEIRKIANSPDVSKIIDLDLGVIRLQPEHTKTRFVRRTTIQPNLAAWLRAYPLGRFPLIPTGAERSVKAVRKRFGLGDDVARHSFVSMFVGKFRSVADAALQAGNSESVVRRHYLDLVSEAEAAAYWGVAPKASAAVAQPAAA